MEAILKKELISDRVTCRFIGAISFLILITLSAFVRIPLPFTPVPITLQTFFVLLCGAFLGTGLGFSVLMGYLALGVFGLPVFTGAGSGLLYLFGPTGGYLAGFMLACLVIAKNIKRASTSLLSTFALFCLADFLLLACGTLWLKIISGGSLVNSVFIGFLPFVIGDLFKAFAAAALYLRFRRRLNEIF